MSHGSILFPHKQFLVGQGHVCQLKMHNVVRHRMRNLSICVKQRILYRYDLLSKILYYHTLGLKINGANEFVLYFPEKTKSWLVGYSWEGFLPPPMILKSILVCNRLSGAYFVSYIFSASATTSLAR